MCVCVHHFYQHGDVAGTTEKIFESKSHLYDIYVDNQNIQCSSPAMKDLLKTCDADNEKLTKLNNQRWAENKTERKKTRLTLKEEWNGRNIVSIIDRNGVTQIYL